MKKWFKKHKKTQIKGNDIATEDNDSTTENNGTGDYVYTLHSVTFHERNKDSIRYGR